MLNRLFRRNRVSVAVFLLALLLFLVVAGCGGSKKDEKYIDETLGKIIEANLGIASAHTEAAIYYENTQFGSGQVHSMIIDSNEKDAHDQLILFDQVVADSIYVNGRLYDRDVTTNTWQEVPIEPVDYSSEHQPQMLESLSQASSKEYIGYEMINGLETEHWHFSLNPEFAVNKFLLSLPSDISQNTGSDVDLWIDKDNYYIVRQDIVIHDVLISDEIGHGDLRFVINFSKINEPVEITPPI
jgi:hypothetical protein